MSADQTDAFEHIRYMIQEELDATHEIQKIMAKPGPSSDSLPYRPPTPTLVKNETPTTPSSSVSPYTNHITITPPNDQSKQVEKKTHLSLKVLQDINLRCKTPSPRPDSPDNLKIKTKKRDEKNGRYEPILGNSKKWSQWRNDKY